MTKLIKLSTIGRFLPYFASAFSILGCLVFLRFYLIQTSLQFAEDFGNQNEQSINSGDSFKLAERLNGLSANFPWTCISAKKQQRVFLERSKGSSCDEGFLSHSVSIPTAKDSPVNIQLTMTLPSSVLLSGFAFMILQLIILWSLFFSARRATISNERKQTEHDRKLFKFSEQVAHDIRGPLSALNSIASLFPEDDEKAKLLKLISSRINSIAESLLPSQRSSLLHTNAGSISITQIQDILRDVIREMSLGASSDIKLLHILGLPNPSQIKASAGELHRILANLVANALEATKTGQITAGLELSKSLLFISIVDTGAGIPSETIPKLFQHGATFGKPNGNGLGLSGAKNQIEHWGGSIQIFSELGRGTMVRISLPVIQT
jgi:signal transduction histidine kinase